MHTYIYRLQSLPHRDPKHYFGHAKQANTLSYASKLTNMYKDVSAKGRWGEVVEAKYELTQDDYQRRGEKC